jgi:hypothetical protein
VEEAPGIPQIASNLPPSPTISMNYRFHYYSYNKNVHASNYTTSCQKHCVAGSVKHLEQLLLDSRRLETTAV